MPNLMLFPSSEWMRGLLIGISWIAACMLASCGNAGVDHLADHAHDSLKDQNALLLNDLGDTAPPIDTALLALLKPCDGFDYPVGPPNAEHYFKARGFLPKDLEHLGEDWNGEGGGNSDFGDFVFAAADGVVFFTKYVGPGWGIVVRILHNYGTAATPRYVESFYAHVSASWVSVGYYMRRGEIIGTIGNANGKYHAHLHYEMRKRPGKEVGSGYAGDTLGFVDPTAFTEAHRPQK